MLPKSLTDVFPHNMPCGISNTNDLEIWREDCSLTNSSKYKTFCCQFFGAKI